MKTALFLAAALATVAATPAAAQRSEAAHNQWRTEMARFTQCLADRETADSQAVLALDPASEEYSRASRALIRSNTKCIDLVDLNAIDPVLLSGGLAEALLRTGKVGQGSAALIAYNEADAETAMGMCVARNAPTLTRSLLRTAVVGRSEYEAALALEGTISGCKGAKVAPITPARLRAVAAISAYRLVAAGELDVDTLKPVEA